MKSLLILGAGGFGQMVKETAIQLGYEEIVFLDDAAFGKGVSRKVLRLYGQVWRIQDGSSGIWE